MYNLLAILAGMAVSIMVLLNGELTQTYGIYFAMAISHTVGVISAIILCIARKEKIEIERGTPIWLYFGGVIGVLTLLFNNYAFGRISMTCIVALGFCGQSIVSVVFDSFGLLGIGRHLVNRNSIYGFLFVVVGFLLMMDQSVSVAAPAALLSVGAGITVVLSRTVNYRLSKETSPLVGSLMNHLVGLPICIALAYYFQGSFQMGTASAKPWIYMGGLFGVVTVLIFNIAVPKVSAFRLTLLSFIGQVFTGIALDFALGLTYSNASFIGGLVITAGLLINMALEQWSIHKKQKYEMYWKHIRDAENAHWERLLGNKKSDES